MILLLLCLLFVSVQCRDLLEPKFRVLTPNELMIEVPQYEDLNLVTFRIGVRRLGQLEDDLELGENDVQNNRIFLYDQRLNLKEGDVVNFLLAFKDKDGYQAQSGKYYFNGVYYKKPFARRHRFRREVTSTDTPTIEKSQDNRETEEFDPTEPRFGGGHHPHHGHWPRGHHPHGFNPHGPPRRPPFPVFPSRPDFGGPEFGDGCNDHRHDRCHGRDSERWSNNKNKDYDSVEYHCQMCHNKDATTVKSTSTTDENFPDIDIRFAD